MSKRLVIVAGLLLVLIGLSAGAIWHYGRPSADEVSSSIFGSMSGYLDKSFGNGLGYATFGLQNASHQVDGLEGDTIVDSHGQIFRFDNLIVKEEKWENGVQLSKALYQPVLAKFTPDGTLDTSFNDKGWVSFDKSAEKRFSAKIDVENERLYLLDSTLQGEYIICRYLFDGQLDLDFGSNGQSDPLSVTQMGTKPSFRLDDQGRTYLIGIKTEADQGILYKVRLLDDGRLDQEFDTSSVGLGYDALLKSQSYVYQGKTIYPRQYFLKEFDIDGSVGLDILASQDGGIYNNPSYLYQLIHLNANGTLSSQYEGAGSKVIIRGSEVYHTYSGGYFTKDRLYLVTYAGYASAKIYAFDRQSGEPISSFGTDGVISNASLISNVIPDNNWTNPKKFLANTDDELYGAFQSGYDDTYYIFKMLPTGKLDLNFATDGVRKMSGDLWKTELGGYHTKLSLTSFSADGNIILSGWTDELPTETSSSSRAILAKLLIQDKVTSEVQSSISPSVDAVTFAATTDAIATPTSDVSTTAPTTIPVAVSTRAARAVDTNADHYQAQVVSQSDSAVTVRAGETVTIETKLANTGSATWYQDYLNLGTIKDMDRCPGFDTVSGWYKCNRARFVEESVAPGETATYRMTWRVPVNKVATTFHESFAPVADEIVWLNNQSVSWDVTILPAAAGSASGPPVDPDGSHYSYTFVSQSTNSQTIHPGETAEFTITLKNTGSATWYQDYLSLGTERNQDNVPGFDVNLDDRSADGWYKCNRARFQETQVAPGETATFHFRMTAPSNKILGTYRYYLRPVVDEVAWLDDIGMFFDVGVVQ